MLALLMAILVALPLLALADFYTLAPTKTKSPTTAHIKACNKYKGRAGCLQNLGCAWLIGDAPRYHQYCARVHSFPPSSSTPPSPGPPPPATSAPATREPTTLPPNVTASPTPKPTPLPPNVTASPTPKPSQGKDKPCWQYKGQAQCVDTINCYYIGGFCKPGKVRTQAPQ